LFGFPRVDGRDVVAAFDGGTITSDAGALLLGATDRAIGLVERFAACFTDRRNQDLIEHEVATLVGQRVFGIALGYEDLIDHDILRHDPIMALLAGKLAARRAKCAPVAGKSTLNRLELRHRRQISASARRQRCRFKQRLRARSTMQVDSVNLERALSRPHATRYHKIAHDPAAIEALFVDVFLESHAKAPAQIILDLDATDDPLHGHQEGRFFHGYYDTYCYLPLYVFCGRHLLAAKLRRSNIDAAAGSVGEIARIVSQIRKKWPAVRILLRADSGFCREDLMAWCEANRVDFLFGLARNDRLVAEIAPQMAQAEAQARQTGEPARRFADFQWSTLDSWSRPRRVVGKAEWTGGAANPRFVVTSLKRKAVAGRYLYEKIYCARGEMENRIKECQLDLFADRTSAHPMHANQLRLWFASLAYVLLAALRRIALRHTQFADATCGSIRLRLLKIGALVKTSVRRVKIAMASGCPYAYEFGLAHALLANAVR
jgi:hypothetical protein